MKKMLADPAKTMEEMKNDIGKALEQVQHPAEEAGKTIPASVYTAGALEGAGALIKGVLAKAPSRLQQITPLRRMQAAMEEGPSSNGKSRVPQSASADNHGPVALGTTDKEVTVTPRLLDKAAQVMMKHSVERIPRNQIIPEIIRRTGFLPKNIESLIIGVDQQRNPILSPKLGGVTLPGKRGILIPEELPFAQQLYETVHEGLHADVDRIMTNLGRAIIGNSDYQWSGTVLEEPFAEFRASHANSGNLGSALRDGATYLQKNADIYGVPRIGRRPD
jgi:hypothetical protein